MSCVVQGVQRRERRGIRKGCESGGKGGHKCGSCGARCYLHHCERSPSRHRAVIEGFIGSPGFAKRFNEGLLKGCSGDGKGEGVAVEEIGEAVDEKGVEEGKIFDDVAGKEENEGVSEKW